MNLVPFSYNCRYKSSRYIYESYLKTIGVKCSLKVFLLRLFVQYKFLEFLYCYTFLMDFHLLNGYDQVSGLRAIRFYALFKAL